MCIYNYLNHKHAYQNTAINEQWLIEQNKSSYSTILKNAESSFQCCGWDLDSVVNSTENAQTNYNSCLSVSLCKIA